jgi:hypothetical protein
MGREFFPEGSPRAFKFGPVVATEHDPCIDLTVLPIARFFGSPHYSRVNALFNMILHISW